MGRDAGGIDRVQGPVDQVEGGVSRVGRGVQKLDEGMEAAARGIQESIACLKRLQAPNYRYPHLVEVKETQAEGKRSVWSRLRGMFVTDVRLHFLCSFDMSKVPCGVGGNGYRLRKTRRWVKKFSPALQVTLAIATVALKAVAGAELQGSSDFMHGVEDGLVEELADLSFDQDVLLGVSSGGEDAEAALRKSACFSGEEDAGAVLRRSAWASYEAITEFMNKEETKRRSKAKNVDSYIDFRDSMREVDDGTGGLVWVRTENVPRWRELMPAAAPAS